MKNNRDKSDEDGRKEKETVSVIALFRYSNAVDKLLLVIGLLAAIASAGVYSIMFPLYGRFAGIYTDLARSEILNETTRRNSSKIIDRCLKITEGGLNFEERVKYGLVVYICVGFASLVTHYLTCISWCMATDRQINRIRNLLFEKILGQEMKFFDEHCPSDLCLEITNHLNTLRFGMGLKLTNSVSMLTRSIAFLILSFTFSWKAALVLLSLVPPIIGCNIVMSIMMQKYTLKENRAYAVADRIAQEALSSLRTVLSFGLEERKANEYKEKLNKEESITIRKGIVNGIFAGITSLLFHSVFGLSSFFLVQLYYEDCENNKISELIQVFLTVGALLMALGNSLPFLKDLSEARVAANGIFKILESRPKIDVKENSGKIIKNLNGNIEFKNVHFKYPQRPDVTVLQGVDLTVESGKTIALCGSSGAGKSTVIQLLQRFYDPDCGCINVDGVDIKQLDLAWLRSKIASVSQEPVLFALTIKENIRLGRLEASDEEIVKAAKEANAHDFIMSLKDGYETMCGERGSQMSGGQKQRIAIARAIIKNAKILLLDESTSALDTKSEKLVQEALESHKQSRTTIIVAHRLSTIKNADLIVVMADGQVAETGTHESLLEKQGVYYNLVMRQTKEENVDKPESPHKNDDADIHLAKFNEVNKPPSSGVGSLNMFKRLANALKLDLLLWSMSKNETLYLVLGTICQVISASALPVILILFSEIYNIVTVVPRDRQIKESLKLTGIVYGMAGAGFLATIGYNYAFSLSSVRLTQRLRSKAFTSMLRQELAWHDQDENRSGILATRLAASIPYCKGLTIEATNLFLEGMAGVGIALIVSFVINWKLAFIMFAFIPLLFIAGVITANINSRGHVKSVAKVEEAGKMVIECSENIKTLVSLGREDYFISQFQKSFQENFKQSLVRLNLEAFFYGISNSVLFFLQAAAFSYAYKLVESREIKVADLYRIYSSITFSALALGKVFIQMPDRKKASDAAKLTFKIINRRSAIDSMSQDGLKPSTVVGRIEFQDVHFRYPTRRENRILEGFSLIVNPNETTALVGTSGSGKSTVIHLLQRFYDVDHGRITLDGVDIRDLNIKWLRSHMGLVSQEPVLFNCSIFDNISSYGDAKKEEEVIKAATQANIHSKVTNLPMKYDTIVGAKGEQLSGGEKQRVAIARALFKKPKILLLDEATSALDSKSEELVQDALSRAQEGRTCICIAHRMSTIENADKIINFK